MRNVYESDDHGVGGGDPDPAEAVPALLVRVAGVALMASGMLVATSGAQLWTFFVLEAAWVRAVATAMVVVGASAVPLGGLYFQARTWGVAAATGLSGSMALLAVLWLGYSLWVALFSPVMVLAAGASALAFVLVVVAAPLALRAAAARDALYR